jgi:hypothetical protein
LSKYYQVVGLKPGSEIIENAQSIKVDLSYALQRPFSHNDLDIIATLKKGDYIWASGGGTYLLNERYLPIVQRHLHAKVNPTKFSLFTGRADNTEELFYPELLVRELFEELILFSGHCLLRPDCKSFPAIIEQVFEKIELNLGLDISGAKRLQLKHFLCSPKKITVRHEDLAAPWEGMLDYHLSSNGEVNILFLLSGEVDIDKLQAMDGEFYLLDGKALRQERNIYIYDINTGLGKDITLGSKASDPISIPRDSMTEHLQHLLDLVKLKLRPGS